MIKQEMPSNLVVKALKHYQNHLASLKEQIGEKAFHDVQALCNDEFDLLSEIALYENSKVELTFSQDFFYNKFSNITGVDYPDYGLPINKIEVETYTRTKLSKMEV